MNWKMIAVVLCSNFLPVKIFHPVGEAPRPRKSLKLTRCTRFLPPRVYRSSKDSADALREAQLPGRGGSSWAECTSKDPLPPAQLPVGWAMSRWFTAGISHHPCWSGWWWCNCLLSHLWPCKQPLPPLLLSVTSAKPHGFTELDFSGTLTLICAWGMPYLE